jgi:hypothetical protein
MRIGRDEANPAVGRPRYGLFDIASHLARWSAMHLLERGARPLADILDGEQVEVVEIVFECVRRLCPPIELHPGDILSCERRTSRVIALRRHDGARVQIDPFYASFVAIRAHIDSNDPPGD